MVLPASLDNFLNGPRLPKVVLGVFGILLLGAGAYFLLLTPLQAEVTELATRREALQREVVQNRAIVAELTRFRRELVALEQRLALLKEKLPTERETPPLYRTVHEAAVQSGLAVTLFQPRDPRPKDYYSEIPITVNVEGGYHDLGHFLERVARLPRVVNVGELKATGLNRTRTSLRAELTLATYMYRPVGSTPPPAPGARPAAQPAPPAPKPPGAKP
jgi:type IV pilus assembly protein PilO